MESRLWSREALDPRPPVRARAPAISCGRRSHRLIPSSRRAPWAVGGPPAKAILTVADDIGADLIVAGSRGRGQTASAVLGSVSTEILHGAHCDVLVVRPA